MEIFYIAILTLIASIIGTITGFGISTIMIPILVIFLPPVEVIFLVAIIHWFGDAWKILLFRGGLHIRLLVLFGVVGLIMSYVGASLSLAIDQSILLRVLGVFFVLYSLFVIFQSKFRILATNMTAVFGGALSGLFAGMFGMGGAIRGVFLSVFNLPKAVYIATAGAIGIVIDSTRIFTYFTQGTVLPEWLWQGLFIFIPVSFFGAWISRRIVNRIPQNKFRILVSVFLILIGIKLLFWA